MRTLPARVSFVCRALVRADVAVAAVGMLSSKGWVWHHDACTPPTAGVTNGATNAIPVVSGFRGFVSAQRADACACTDARATYAADPRRSTQVPTRAAVYTWRTTWRSAPVPAPGPLYARAGGRAKATCTTRASRHCAHLSRLLGGPWKAPGARTGHDWARTGARTECGARHPSTTSCDCTHRALDFTRISPKCPSSFPR